MGRIWVMYPLSQMYILNMTIHFVGMCLIRKRFLLQMVNLTLRKIFFTHGDSERGRLNPYMFNYSDLNPVYHPKAQDRWGTYQPPNCGQGLASWEYPYVNQEKLEPTDPGYDVNNLNKRFCRLLRKCLATYPNHTSVGFFN